MGLSRHFQALKEDLLAETETFKLRTESVSAEITRQRYKIHRGRIRASCFGFMDVIFNRCWFDQRSKGTDFVSDSKICVGAAKNMASHGSQDVH